MPNKPFRTQTAIFSMELIRPQHAVSSGYELDCRIARKTRDANTGKYVFPGGGLRDGELLDDCLIRETRSETGITVMPIHSEPFVHIRTPGDGIAGSPVKLVVPTARRADVKEFPVRSDELTGITSRSVGQILNNMADALAPVYLMALQHFANSGVLDRLAQQPHWSSTLVAMPSLPEYAWEPMADLRRPPKPAPTLCLV